MRETSYTDVDGVRPSITADSGRPHIALQLKKLKCRKSTNAMLGGVLVGKARADETESDFQRWRKEERERGWVCFR